MLDFVILDIDLLSIGIAYDHENTQHVMLLCFLKKTSAINLCC